MVAGVYCTESEKNGDIHKIWARPTEANKQGNFYS